MCFRLPLTPPSSYMGELPNSHGRTLTDESYVMHGILSGTALTASFFFDKKALKYYSESETFGRKGP
jgi:hypothetical protein